MRKMIIIFFVTIFCAFVIFLVVSMRHNDLIYEIQELQKPKGLEKVRAESVVEKYIPLGVSKAAATTVLINKQFTILEVDKVAYDPNFKNCGDVLVGVYNIIEISWPIDAYKVVVSICFNEERATLIRATYLRQIY